MGKLEFELLPDHEFIELNKLLKLMGVAQTGGHAKLLIEEGLVKVNNEVEMRKRKKLRKGDIVLCEESRIEISTSEDETQVEKTT